MTTREPLFTEEDRAELLALSLYRASLCPLCGKPLEVCTSKDSQGPAFNAEVALCRATAAILEKQRALAPDDDKKPDPYARAYLWAATTRR